MVLDIGGGTPSGGHLPERHRLCGQRAHRRDKFDEAITTTCGATTAYDREATAERIKLEIGSPIRADRAGDLSSRAAICRKACRALTLNSNEILEALQEPLQGIVGAVNRRSNKLRPNSRRRRGAASY